MPQQTPAAQAARARTSVLRATLRVVVVAGLVVSGLKIVASRGSLQPAHASVRNEPFVWNLPEGFPVPKVPADNPMSYVKVELGRHLFFDTRLSHNGTQSCASCHDPKRAFTDNKTLAVGSTGAVHPRNSMSLINVAYMTSYTWANPLITSLEAQALVPLFSQTPIELGNTNQYALLAKFQENPTYVDMFERAFPEDKPAITLKNLARAIACFERTLISAGSPYDQYFYGGDDHALSEDAKRGNILFFSEKTECNHCHSGFNLVDSTQHAGTKVINTPFNNTALYNLDGNGSYPAPNRGVYEVTHDPSDMGRFRAPTLRNIAMTAPYFHDGSARTLDDVLDHYARGGRQIESGEHRGDGQSNPLKSQFVIGFSLSDQERKELHAFFDSLSDATIAQRAEWGEPDRW